MGQVDIVGSGVSSPVGQVDMVVDGGEQSVSLDSVMALHNL